MGNLLDGKGLKTYSWEQKYNKGEKTKPRIPEPRRPVNHINTFSFLLCNNQVMAGDVVCSFLTLFNIVEIKIGGKTRYALVGYLSLLIQRGVME